MQKTFIIASWIFGSVALALMVLAVLATPNQALADGGGGPLNGNPPCSSCYNGCKGFVIPNCPNTNQGCSALAGCGPGGSNCKCISGGNPDGFTCSCI
jgi:hypothetical protein